MFSQDSNFYASLWQIYRLPPSGPLFRFTRHASRSRAFTASTVSPIGFTSVAIETFRPLASCGHPDSVARLTQDLDEFLETLKKPRPDRSKAGGFFSVRGEQNYASSSV